MNTIFVTKKIESIWQQDLPIKKIRRFIGRVLGKIKRDNYTLISSSINKVASYLPLKDQILLESFIGKSNDDNIVLIANHLINTFPNKKIYYALNRKVKPSSMLDSRIHVIPRSSVHYLWLMSRTKNIITNSRIHRSIYRKREDQQVFQIWHGVPWKRLVHDQPAISFENTTPEKYLANFAKDVEKWTYLFAPNAYSAEKFTSAFRPHSEVIPCRYPCVDFLRAIDEKRKATIASKLGISFPNDKKIVLYMPTFREYAMISAGKYMFQSNLDTAFFASHPELIFLVRSHYLVMEKIGMELDNVIDVSKYESVNELYGISDLLISDYSSAIFEFEVQNKPVLCYIPDIEEYKAKRGLYDIADFPEAVHIAYEMEEVETMLATFSTMHSSNHGGFDIDEQHALVDEITARL